MPNEQVLKHGVDAFVLHAIQFRIFVKRHVSRPANLFQFAESARCFAFQSVEFCTHGVRSDEIAILGLWLQEHKQFPCHDIDLGVVVLS